MAWHGILAPLMEHQLIVTNMNKKSSELLKLPIDQYGRYYIVAEIIKSLIKKKKQASATILDIGGYNGSIHKFFNKKEATITVLDTFESSAKNYIRGDALQLPFSDKSFDYVVSFEVFEHIPRADRDTFIREATRVTKGPFILTAPFDSKNSEVHKSEEIVNGLWKHIHGKDHEWLEEHLSYKIPQASELEEILARHELSYGKVGNNDLLLWNIMQSLAFTTTLYRQTGQNQDVQKFYNHNIQILEGDSQLYYRYVYIVGESAGVTEEWTKRLSIDRKDKSIKMFELVNKIFSSLSDDIKILIRDRDSALSEIDNLKYQLDISTQDNMHLKRELTAIKQSKAWKLSQKLSNAHKKITPHRGKNHG